MGNNSENNGNKSGNKDGRVMVLVHCTFLNVLLKFQVDRFCSFEVLALTKIQSEN